MLIARGSDGRERRLSRAPHSVFVRASISDDEAMAAALVRSDAVAHCAGINQELGTQTYQRVHVEGTRMLVRAAQRAGVRRIAMISFLRARPHCGSGYHESKWEAEEIIRGSGLAYTILKCGIVYGRGDHLLDHITHALHTTRLFATLQGGGAVAPVAVEDVARA